MKINLFPRAEDISSGEIAGTDVIVIDMLRATSVITTALHNGAMRVIPVLTVDDAFKLRDEQKDVVLGGERKGVKIEGFDAGNSPLEFAPDFILGKTLVITTSNGTRAINACRDAKNIFIGSMLNGPAAANKAAADCCDIRIACAGTLGRFSLDDFICAGYIIDEILKTGKYELSDISFLSHHIYIENRDNVEDFLRNASHFKYLVSIGAYEDIKYCCKKGIIDEVPVYRDGAIKLK